MLNKRAARLLALLLTSSMVLMGPSAAMASTSAGDSKETSQTEQQEIEETDLGEDPNAEVDVDAGEDPDADEDPDEEKDADLEEDPDEVKATEKAKEPEKDKKIEKTEKKTKDKKEETEKEPAHAKEGTTSGGDSVSGGDHQDDETGDRIISSNAAVSVNGTISGNIVISSADGANLTLNGVKAAGLRVEKVTGPVLIGLLGQNTVDEIVVEEGTKTKVSINGSGVLSSNKVSSNKSVVIMGGNIQIQPKAFVRKPVNENGDPIYPVKIAGSLAKDRLYKDLAIKTGSPLKAYPYNKEIRTSTNGELMMYLPSGKVQVTLDGHQYEGNVVEVNAGEPVPELKEAGGTSTPSPAVPPQAQAARNGLYDIKDGSEYRSGVSINFYATGDRYDGPNASDEVGATRYVPVSWNAGRVSSTSRASSSWSSYTKKVDGVYRFEGAYTPKLGQDESRLEYTLRVDYQKQMYDGSAWIPVTGKGAVASKTVDFYVSNASDEPDPASQQANPADNGIFWINPGATYRSGASLQFYATGDGYGPEEAQELNPLPTATRYIPTNWEVTTTNAANGSSDKGSWKKYTEETLGNDTSGNYVPGEYRFKDSFVLSTNQATSVPYTLKVTYKKQAYNGTRWTDDGTTSTKEVNFFIRNTAVTATPSYRPTTTPYYRSGVTTTASRSSVSSNARNARTMDDTPVGPLVLLMMAAAGSGAFIFRRKRNRS